MGSLVGGILGINPKKSGAPIRNWSPVSFTTPGLTGNVTREGVSLTPSTTRTDAFANLSNIFSTQASELGGVKDQVSGAFGAMAKAGSEALSSSRRKAIGNLRENLTRRRVMGSSFGEDALSRAEAEFGQKEAQFLAETKLKELEAQTNLINQQAQAAAQEFTTQINQMNIDANLAANLTQNMNTLLSGLAQAEAGLISDAQTSGGSAALDLLGTGIGFLTGGLL